MKRLVFTGGTLVALAVGTLAFLVTLTPAAPLVAMVQPSLSLVPEAQAQESGGTAGQYRATMFLRDETRARLILQFLHYDSTFRGHELIAAENDAQDGGPFTVTICYRYDGTPEDALHTDVVFHFAGNGSVDGFLVVKTSAPSHNQPFMRAAGMTLALKLLLYAAIDQDSMSPIERQIYNAAMGAKPAEMLLGILELDQL